MWVIVMLGISATKGKTTAEAMVFPGCLHLHQEPCGFGQSDKITLADILLGALSFCKNFFIFLLACPRARSPEQTAGYTG
jgi:hypothetical protein